MLARKPVIATRAGGAAEIATDRKNGILVTPGSTTELFNAIELLCDNKELSAGLAAAGRLHAESAYSMEIMADRVRQVLQNLPATPR
jgi:glycosyltransferase involved in cell wall biosynthesis